MSYSGSKFDRMMSGFEDTSKNRLADRNNGQRIASRVTSSSMPTGLHLASCASLVAARCPACGLLCRCDKNCINLRTNFEYSPVFKFMVHVVLTILRNAYLSSINNPITAAVKARMPNRTSPMVPACLHYQLYTLSVRFLLRIHRDMPRR